MPLRTPYRKRRDPRRPRTMIPDYGLPPIPPPAPAPVHIVGLDRVGQLVLSFTFDTLLIDTASCGDLKVQGLGPTAATQTGDYSLEAVYPAMVNGNRWTAASLDNEPTFANNAPLATDGGRVPDWL